MQFILMQHMYTVAEQINGTLGVYLYLNQNTYDTFLLILCVAVAEFRSGRSALAWHCDSIFTY